MSSINDLVVAVIEVPLLSKEECESIIDYAKHIGSRTGVVGEKGKEEGKFRKSTVKWINYGEENSNLFKKMNDISRKLNETIWKYNLDTENNPIQFTEYKAPDGHYSWHIDTAQGRASRRKLSICIQLSDPIDYEGGELLVQSTKLVTVNKTRGNAAIFPSTLAHIVNPVVSGNRYSLVAWLTGDPFR